MVKKHEHYKENVQRRTFASDDLSRMGEPYYEDFCHCGRSWPCKKAPKKLRKKVLN